MTDEARERMKDEIIDRLVASLEEFMEVWNSGDASRNSERARRRRAAMWEKAEAAIAAAKEKIMKHKIIVVKRTSDYMAFLDGDQKMWGCGKSPAEAVASVIYSHQRECEVSIAEKFDYAAICRMVSV